MAGSRRRPDRDLRRARLASLAERHALEPANGDPDRLSKLERVLWPRSRPSLALTTALTAIALLHAPTAWDDANIWSLRGLALYAHGELVPGIFRNPEFSFVHLDYPLLQPVLEASFLRGLGGVDTRLWHLELWILFAATLWTLGWLLTPYGRRWLWIVPVAVGLLSPLVFIDVTLGNADAFMAGLLACGVVSVGLWLQQGRLAYALLGALFLAGAANLKNEGLAFVVCVLVSATVAVLAAGVGGRRRSGFLAGSLVVLCVLPWQLWLAGNPYAVNLTPPPWKAIQNPASLVDRLDFLWRGFEQIALQFASTPTWHLTIPSFIVLAAFLFQARIARPLVTFYVLAWLLGVLVIAYTYWVTPIFDLSGFETRTGPRIVSGVVFIGLAGLAHMLQVAARASQPVNHPIATGSPPGPGAETGDQPTASR